MAQIKTMQTETSSDSPQTDGFCRPAVDVAKEKEDLVLRADIPGSSLENLTINYENGTLSITGKRIHEVPEGMQVILEEYEPADFYREFSITQDIDASRITAEYLDGVLVVHLPVAPSAKPRKIEVKNGSF